MTIERTQELADNILNQIAEGKSLREICDADAMPSRETVRRWLRDDAEFCGQYARAREEQADFFADEIIEIADTDEDPQKARVRIDARKWVASRLKPKKYGSKIVQEFTGADGGPIQTEKSSARERIISRIESLAARIETPSGD